MDTFQKSNVEYSFEVKKPITSVRTLHIGKILQSAIDLQQQCDQIWFQQK